MTSLGIDLPYDCSVSGINYSMFCGFTSGMLYGAIVGAGFG